MSLTRPPDNGRDRREVLYFTAVLLIQTFRPPYRNFTEGQESKILPRFSTPVTFEALWFRNAAKYRMSRHNGERL